MKEKSNIFRVKIENWDKLVSMLNGYFANWPQYIFRGHSQSDWLLESTLSRALKQIKYPDKAKLVRQHLDRFKLSIRGRRGKNPRQLSENELWALGQHYGLHTPLLDWSQSPYVGLFFALTNTDESPTGFRTLWGLNASDIERITKWYKKRKRKDNIELVNPILDENERLVNQRGVFTKAPLVTDIENWVMKGPNIGWTTLCKIDFPEKLRDEGIAHLNQMNINHSSLYPDLTGSSLDTNIKLELIDYLEQKQVEQWEEAESDEKWKDSKTRNRTLKKSKKK